MTERLDILVLADRDSKALWPLTESLPPPLLPLGGKPLIDHVIEALATCVNANVTIVVSAGDTQTAAHLAKRGYPRLSISVTDRPTPVLDRDMLVFRGDIATSPAETRRFIERSGAPGAPVRHAPEQGAWRLAAGDLTPTWRHTSVLANQSDRMLPTIAAYWRVSLAAGGGAMEGLEPAGWVGSDGLRSGLCARVLTRRAPGENVLIGAGAFIDKLVALGDNVVVGDDCYIARGARLSNTVVMPRSYVGPGLDLDAAVVSGGWLCRIDTGAAIRISDDTVIGALAA